jgi:hypothetical protein
MVRLNSGRDVSIELSVDAPEEGLAPPMFPVLLNFPLVLFEGRIHGTHPEVRAYP